MAGLEVLRVVMQERQLSEVAELRRALEQTRCALALSQQEVLRLHYEVIDPAVDELRDARHSYITQLRAGPDDGQNRTRWFAGLMGAMLRLMKQAENTLTDNVSDTDTDSD